MDKNMLQEIINKNGAQSRALNTHK